MRRCFTVLCVFSFTVHSLPRRGFLGFAEFVIIVFSIFRLLLECGQLIDMKKLIQLLRCSDKRNNTWIIKPEYFYSLSNYLEIPMYLLSIAFVTTTNSCFCPSPLQWQAGAVAVFFAWIALILFLNKWPDLGIYIGIIWKITIRFLSVSVIATLLLLSFTFTFYMAFYEPDLPVSCIILYNIMFINGIWNVNYLQVPHKYTLGKKYHNVKFLPLRIHLLKLHW